ncbi:Type III restriction-modification system methylation subunit (EC 2.1.1.72) [uncultured Gammaproteobacteria bacterium]|jgi:adenine-specific DNA-methyltransferase|nr:Type III restriction-modification system methylation subunit (EC 2.1.1.72) [uncultured Gammaproteobacteria bacterium]
MSFNQQLETLLKTLDKFTDKEGILLKQNIKHHAEQFDSELIKLLLNNKTTKAHFFDAIDEATIFNYRKFIDYIDDKNFLIDSYTKFANKVGLTISNKHMQQINEVVLSFPFKDCVLEGGQSKDDEKRKEIFFNEVLANDEINRLLDKKVITSAKKYTKDGASDEINFKRDENGLIKDNLIIKGNNLLALHTLKSNFAGKVKLIYIDPPYNTGNDSFNYNDNFNHSTWLTFMKNRLEVARDLLSDDGVIFVQCDDNEQAYLKVLMDEIFGREEFVCNMIWEKKTGASDAKEIAVITEFSILYSKNKNNLSFTKNTKSYDVNRYKLQDEYVKIRGNYYIDNLDRGGLQYSDSLNFGIKCPDGSISFPNGRKSYFNDGWIWKWSKNKIIWAIENNFLEFRRSKDKKSGWSVCYKNYLKVDNKNNPISRSAPHKNLIQGVLNTHASLEIIKIFGEKNFSHPKPEELLQRIIELSTKKGDLVLDYHLGSGTTCAVAHKMGRQYIGIEQMDYIEDIAVKRMQKVIGKKTKKDGELLERVDFDNGGISKSVDWQGGGEFIYFELDKYNQAFIEKIAKVNEKNILKLYDDIIEKAFLNYDVESEKLKDKKQDFKALNLGDKKEFLFSILNKNQLYKNLSEINDKDLQVDENVKALNKGFYNE